MCVTSIGRPLGRPPIQANHRGQAEDARSLCDARAKNAVSTHRGRRVTMETNSPPPSQRQSTEPGPSQYFGSTRASGHANITSVMWSDTSSFPAALSTSEGPAISSPGAHPLFPGLNVPDLDFEDLEDMAVNLDRDIHEPMQYIDDKVSSQGGVATPSTSDADDTGTHVVSLLGSISHQLAELKDQPWESWSPHLTRESFHQGRDPESTNSHGLWNRVLNVSMRFAAALQTVARAASPALSLTLMLLSTYVRLGELFEVVLDRMGKCLHEGKPDAGASAAAPARLLMEPTSIQLIMMTEVFEYQMHTVQRLMGLPAEYRIWDRRDGATDAEAGILGNKDSSEVVRAVMRQSRETFQAIRQNIDLIKGFAR
ncbi:hypothetical protein LX32DRAFT_667728 [Colletotrichum zoysiae]|uniref:Uncharacterized protein n=1 Tax=Colletotrichum zoysiae TaxID=1216348 RepID=A0AAD9H7C6_9PEZI|nr:hypothetical protein LX32DRAFT_667728 [Colletotrichum zoysiae]